jgi:N-acetyl-gamma-glutamyl-phosphate reductase common form
VSDRAIPAFVLGATGYVGGELLRLLAAHPRFVLAAAVSSSSAGTPVAEVFPHLALMWPEARFASMAEAESRLAGRGPLAVFAALPHGESAARIACLLELAPEARVVDISADFRLRDPALHARIYGRAHGAPGLLDRFFCGLPELEAGVPGPLVAHPGCFTTAVTLAAAPLVAEGLVEPRIHVSAVTGSTGSGREPGPATHHPERHGNYRAYSPLAHRHEFEMRELLRRATRGAEVDVAFVPHSGPFARGIHATVHARLQRPVSAAELREACRAFYAGAPFVQVLEAPPALKTVVGSNRALLGVAARGDTAVVLSVIDNLTKGAAGGAIQWMNRLFGLPETAGLLSPALGWS